MKIQVDLLFNVQATVTLDIESANSDNVNGRMACVTGIKLVKFDPVLVETDKFEMAPKSHEFNFIVETCRDTIVQTVFHSVGEIHVETDAIDPNKLGKPTKPNLTLV